MPLPPHPSIPCLVGEPREYPDPFARGLAYLQQVQKLALDANLIVLNVPARDQIALCTWIGLHIDRINLELNHCLQACQSCFHEWEHRPLQIYAAPFNASYGIDGLCNLHTLPPTILIDAGRVESWEWLGLVAHEYAHAHVGSGGHGRSFYAALSHLCLGLGLPQPPPEQEDQLKHWPPSCSRVDAIGFWRGKHWPCPLPLSEEYSRKMKDEG